MTLINEALEYARQGFEIFPLKPDKTPYRSQHRATTNTHQIRTWWGEWPDALIGHRVAPGMVLLDIDPHNGGIQTWQKIVDEIDLPTTRCHYSGRDNGGFHVWFLWPLKESDLTQQWLNELGGGVDVLRHNHRYTILPPSPHPVTGKPYTWATTEPVADCPPALIELLTAPPAPVQLARIDLGAGLPATRQLERAPIASPADWYSANATWSELLGRHGWQLVKGDGDYDGSKWRRPGSTNPWSATIKNGCLFAYTPNTVFEETTPGNPHGYTRFAALAELEHNGDASAAAHAVYTMPGAPGKPQRSTPAAAAPLIDPPPMSPQTAEQAATETEQLSSLFVDGADFIFNVNEIPAIWGEDQGILWAEGEPFLVCGGIGAGKTTLTNQLVRARLGITDNVLGWPVKPTDANVLYLASDRPSQIARAMGRLYTDADADVLGERLRVVKGPPPADLAQRPDVLLQLARAAEADTVFLDSLKDMAGSLSNEDVGAGLNKAMQLCVANGVEIVANHHGRKATGDNPKPNKLADVYGSTWITSGAGSVIYLHGKPGSDEVEVLHLKQPMDDLGPFKIEHDHDAGTSKRLHQWDPLQWLRKTNHPSGVTVKAAARAMTGAEAPNGTQMRKARRHLDRLLKAEFLTLEQRDNDRGGKPVNIYHPTEKVEQ